MVYMHSFKNQSWLLPPSVEELIPKDHICFVVEGFAESMDYSEYDKLYTGAGHPAYHPRVLLKIIIMGLIDRIRSSRRLARNSRENVVYMYLAEKLAPDFRTISDFRKNNNKLIREMFKHTVTIGVKCGVVDLNVLSTDGTTFKASASRKSVVTEKELDFLTRFVDEQLEEWAKNDQKEDLTFGDLRGTDQVPDFNKNKIQRIVKKYVQEFKSRGVEFKDAVTEKLAKAQNELKTHEIQRVSITDPESRFMKNKKGKKELSFNAQLTVDKKGFILANDVCQDTTDHHQLAPQIEQTKNNIPNLPENINWNFDNGYFSGININYALNNHVNIHVPDQRLVMQQRGKKIKTLYTDTLVYNKDKDIYTTPENDIFTFQYEHRWKKRKTSIRSYILRKNNKKIRRIQVYPHDGERRDMAQKMRTPEAQEIYKYRKQTVEPAIGDLKENKGLRDFITRSLNGVQTEFNIACIGHNLQKIWKHKTKTNSATYFSSKIAM